MNDACIWLCDVTESVVDHPVDFKRYKTAVSLDTILNFIDKYRLIWFDQWGFDVEESDVPEALKKFSADLFELQNLVYSNAWTGYVELARCKYGGIEVVVRVVRLKVY